MFGQGINFGALGAAFDAIADFLVIAGGGSGGGNSNSGGGGAGGYRTSYGSTSGGGGSAESQIDLTNGTIYTFTVGAGGASGPVLGGSGGVSSIAATGLTTISTVGGGGGAGQTGNIAGAAGGSGGGGGYNNQSGGAGTANQGFAGGSGTAGGDYPGGGGGGAGEAGNTDGTGHGGDGLSNLIAGQTQITSTATYQLNSDGSSIPSNTYPLTTRGITYAAGKFGNAAGFSGNNASTGSQLYVSNNIYGGNTSIFSVSLWLKCTNTSGEIPLSGNGGTIGGTQGYALYLENGKLSLTFRSSNGNQDFYGNTTYINDDAWHHIVLTFNNGPYAVYLDGSVSFSGNTSNFLNNTTPSFDTYFGNRWNRNENGVISGQIDQIRVFGTTVLDQAAVTALYNETSTTATYDYVGVTPFYAGGASGGVSGGGTQIPGSDGGGGAGAEGNNQAPVAGATNLGSGGGGGAADTVGAYGGSGLVVFRLPTAAYTTGYTTGSPTITADGSDTILKYTGSGTYGHNMAMPAFLNYLVIAGGASGSSNGGGGGAGGLRTSYGGTSGGGAGAESAATLSAGTYTITIGAGGAAQTTYQDRGLAGSASSISGNLTVNTVGGGGGGSNNTPDGISGGSGGGAGSTPSGGGHSGGAGTSNEGFAGGNTGSNGHPYVGAGGGGSGAAASNVTTTPGVGGTGLSVSINGSSTAYAGGGGGSGGTQGATGGAGGAGGGGQGGTGSAGQSGYAATANTGSGGGASGDGGNSGAGGSGIIILRMATSHYSGTTTGSPGVTTDGSSTILTYTGSGTYVHS